MTSTKDETAFIKFCQDVAHDLACKPSWLTNLNLFNKIFLKYVEHNKSHLPIVSFIERNRKTLELPIVDGMEPNDKWLLFPKGTPEPTVKHLGCSKPRGVFLEMKEDDYSRCLPLSEVYAVCVSAAGDGAASRSSFHGVAMESVPALFLNLFYAMLLEAEPENTHFKENVTITEDLLTQVESPPGLGDAFGSIMQTDGAKQLQSVFQSVISSIDPSAKEMLQGGLKDFTEKGDLSGLFAGIAPMLQQSGLNDILTGFMKGMPGMTGVMPGAPQSCTETAASDSLMIETKAEDQE